MNLHDSYGIFVLMMNESCIFRLRGVAPVTPVTFWLDPKSNQKGQGLGFSLTHHGQED